MNVQFKKLSIIVLALLAVFAIMIPCVSADEATEPALELAVATDVAPANESGLVSVATGENINVTFSAVKNDGLATLGFEIAYDPAVLDVVNLKPDGSVEVTGLASFASFKAQIENEKFRVEILFDPYLKTTYFEGDLFTVTFRVLNAEYNATSIDFSNVKAFDNGSKLSDDAIRATGATLYAGHNFTNVEVVIPTCEAEGYSYVECTDCDFIYKFDFVDALGHDIVEDEAVAPSCTGTGMTAGEHCTRCGKIFVAQEIVDALGHKAGDAVEENRVEATCTEDGKYDAVVYCTVCYAELSRENVVIPALGHKAGDAVEENRVEATCTEDGKYDTVVYCTVCNAELSRENVVIPALGHKAGDAVEENRVEATCTEDGKYDAVVYCTVCNEEIARETVTIPATGHSFDIVVTDPTCLEAGYTTRTCTVCGLVETYDEVEALGHRYFLAKTIDATCTAEGVNTYVCDRCEDTVIETIPTTPHSIIVDAALAPTCTETGLTEGNHCSICEEVFVAQEVVPAIGHDFSAEVVEEKYLKSATDCENVAVFYKSCAVCGAIGEETFEYGSANGHLEIVDAAKAATCTEAGLTEGKHCLVCNKVLVAQEVVPATGHNFSAEVVEEKYLKSAANCENAAVYYKSCAVCGAIGEETFVYGEALGHLEIVDAAKAATCTEAGLTEGKHCLVCGKVLVAQEVVPATGHNFSAEVVEEKYLKSAANCENAAVYYKSCAVCGAIGEETFVYGEALGHLEVAVAAKAPTCTETGLTEGAVCLVCGKILVEQEEVPATGHDFSAEVVAVKYLKSVADCENAAVLYKSCAVCGAIGEETFVYGEALGHDYEVSAVVFPTCTVEGCTTFTCALCGDSYNETQAANGHSVIVDEAVAPTCTETGLTEGNHCSICGEILVAQETVEALGHTEVVDAAVESTCTETGLTEGKHCSVCGEVLVQQETIDALGHDEVVDAAVASTCIKTGLTEGKHCKRCGETLVAQTVVAALGHTEVVDAAEAPTVFETGLTEGKHCARCGEVLVEQEVVAALGILYAWWFWVIIAVVVIAAVSIVLVVVAKKKKAGKEA